MYLIGTTDERFEGDPSTAVIDEHEWRYLIEETERVFPGAAPLEPRVRYTCSGVRPLPHRPRAAESAITRRHLIRRHRSAKGLYSIVGGKLTTHRALAEDVMRTLRRHAPQLPKSSPTRARPLPGASSAAERARLAGELGAAFGSAQAARLARVYGAGAARVAALARDRELGAELKPGGPLAAELIHAIQNEWAVTLEDILQRRCMSGLDADFGLGAASAGADWLRRVGIWDGERAARELAAYRDLARRARAAAAGFDPPAHSAAR
jgi:glycerol-3-phosphate dehydrogenase